MKRVSETEAAAKIKGMMGLVAAMKEFDLEKAKGYREGKLVVEADKKDDEEEEES
jgi:hypothetical protein